MCCITRAASARKSAQQYGPTAAWRDLSLDAAVRQEPRALHRSRLALPAAHNDNVFGACSVVLQAVNFVLAVMGVGMLGYAAYMYINYEHITFPSDPDAEPHHSLLHLLVLAHRHASPW